MLKRLLLFVCMPLMICSMNIVPKKTVLGSEKGAMCGVIPEQGDQESDAASRLSSASSRATETQRCEVAATTRPCNMTFRETGFCKEQEPVRKPARRIYLTPEEEVYYWRAAGGTILLHSNPTRLAISGQTSRQK